MMSWDDNWWYYEPAAPLEVEGGIIARRLYGRFGVKWWGRRWVETLESFDIGARLGRGRSYARSGQVARLQIGAGEIEAEVQGTIPIPYNVVIRLRAFSQAQWETVIARLRRAPAEVGRLLNGEMPERLESMCAAEGLSLFPVEARDLETTCDCPDWSNPCKHIAAVFYILAEVFDDDPFFLLRLRGMDRDAFLAHIGGASIGIAEPEKAMNGEGESNRGTPLPATHDTFWGSPASLPALPTLAVDEEEEALPATPHLLTRIGVPPLWQSARDFEEALRGPYRQAAESAMQYLLFAREDDEIDSLP
ncbi:MAG: SWIM zinc finger family protein [Bacteroidota bacterium]|nr:SWIM zinc finger family protein [Bacteroidota bacterium]